MIRLLLGWLAMLAAAIPCAAMAADGLTDAAMPYVRVRLLAASAAPAPGQSDDLGIAIDPGPGWHIYWQNPGETGYAPRVTWQLPAGATIAPVRHPAPQRLVAAGSTVNVHAGPVVLLTSLAVPQTARVGNSFVVAGTADLLVCSDSMCVPQTVKFSRDLRIGSGAPDATATAELTKSIARLPSILSGETRLIANGKDVLLSGDVPTPAVGETVTVFATYPSAGMAGEARFEPGSPASIRFAQGSLQAGRAHEFVVTYGRPGQPPERAFMVHTGLPAASRTAVRSVPSVWLALAALNGAVLGGLLLNLMPCVFPILSLKAMALVRAGTGPAEARAEALGYLAGAVGVMMALGGAVLLLRAGGNAAGWAFQLQDPRVVALLLVLVMAIATNLAGLFELPSLPIAARGGSGFAGGLGTGALAAFIATPCTGPFMAGALGAAMVLPPLLAMMVFAGLGVGLAAPFLAIGFFERARCLMPKPGHWMVTVRRVLSVPMFATALGFAWLLGQQTGVTGMTIGLAVALTAGLALWWAGLRQRDGKSSRPALATFTSSLLLLPMSMPATGAVSATPSRPSDAIVQPYSAARLSSLRQAHRSVLVYATADWCLTCKVNEATSLENNDVRTAFRKSGAVMLEADWTRGDPAITHLLSDNGRAGVPLYLWYPDHGQSRMLPQVLTPSLVSALVQKP